MNNKETLQTYNERLGTNNTSLESILETINNLPEAGGGGGEITPTPVEYIVENVNFLDYDGTVLYSYTLDEIKSMSELPPLPTNEKYQALYWNWTLDEIIEKNEPVDVGVIYNMDDVAVILNITVTEFMINRSTYLNFSKGVNGEGLNYTIDWGDGSDLVEATVAATSATPVYAEHTYTKTGNYTITVKLTNAVNQKIKLFTMATSSVHSRWFSCFDASSFNSSAYSKGRAWWSSINSIIFGPCCDLAAGAFATSMYNLKTVMFANTPFCLSNYAIGNCYNVTNVNIPRETKVSGSPNNMFYNNYGLKSISFPKTIANITAGHMSYSFQNNRSLEKLILPEGLTQLASQCCSYCYNLKYVSIPDTVTKLGGSCFRGNCALEYVKLPSNLTSIDTYCFSDCTSLVSIDLPTTLVSIGDYAFNNGSTAAIGTTTFDFSKFTTIPTVGTSTFSTTNLKIIVPDELYDEWITTGSWATFSKYIVKASEA